MEIVNRKSGMAIVSEQTYRAVNGFTVEVEWYFLRIDILKVRVRGMCNGEALYAKRK
jgi:hypothetical protein